MNYSWVQRIICLLVTLNGILLYAVSPVAASELVIPQEFTHEGLTFSSGLHFIGDVPTTPVRLSFESVDEIEVTQTSLDQARDKEEKEVLAEQIITPAPKKLLITPAQTLPTLAEPLRETEEKTAQPTVTPNPSPTATPTPIPATPSSSLPFYATNGQLNADVLFSMANQKRAEAGLPAFEKHPDVCAVAESRKPEIENEVYGNSSIHAGFRARSLPWRATENMISQDTEEQAMSWWMGSSIHRAAILGSAKYACVACQNKTCAMIFSSLDSK